MKRKADVKERNWENIIFWIVAVIFIFIIIYLFATGRAFK